MSAEKSFSIRQRLLLATLPVLVLFLLLAGTGLDRAYKRATSQSEFQKLQLQAWSLMADAEIQQQQLVMPDVLQEPGFSQPESHLFGFIYDQSGQRLWQSASADMAEPQVLQEFAGFLGSLRAGQQLQRQLPGGQFLLQQAVTYIDDQNRPYSVTFIVVERGIEFRQQLASYRQSISFWLALTGLVLILLQLVMTSWGLAPLSVLAREIGEMDAGDKNNFSESYPREIAPVTNSLNQLVKTHRQQRERFRNTLGDLAHSLKTPLAALRSMIELEESPQKQPMLNQAERMETLINRQLGRSAGTAAEGAARESINIKAMVERLLSALDTVYASRNLSLQTRLDAGLYVLGDQGDMMEVLGNVLDNAFKYAGSKVHVEAIAANDRSMGSQVVCLQVEDDGPGIANSERESVQQRGVRLDTKREGQGLGLAMAAEIVDAYGGELLLEDSGLGGASVKILLPLAPA